MKIILSYRGAPRIRGWETGAMIATAFRSLNHEVFEYGNIYESPERLEKLDTRNWLDQQFDLLLFCECNDNDSQYLELKTINTKKRASWFFDCSTYQEYWKYLIKQFNFDVNFVANANMVNAISHGVYLPYAASSGLHYRPLTWPKERDFALVGSDRKERHDLINSLRKAGLDAHLITGVFREDYINVLASTKVVINDEAGGGKNLISMRSPETLAAGSVLFNIDTPKLEDFGEHGVHYFKYRNIEELIDISKKIIDDQSLLNEVSKNGQQYCLDNNTYINRAKKIIEICEIGQ